MNNQVTCPHCGKNFEMTQAISHLVEKQKLKFEQERDKLRADARKWKDDQIRKIEEEAFKKKKELEEKIKNKIKDEMSLQMKDKNNELDELRKENKAREEQLLEMNRLIRSLKTESERKQIELEKKLIEEQEKIRNDVKRRIDDEYKLKILEKDKKLLDALKLAEEYKRKLEQGSQQLQGDVLEMEIKKILKNDFPYDEIKDVPTGIRGADILQIVKNNFGRTCGTIIWETKRTKDWSERWIGKLKEDQRRVKAEIAVIITQALPGGIRRFTQKEGVWIGDFESIVGLALLLRSSLLELSTVKSSLVGRQEKKEFFRRKWAREEKNTQILMENLLGIHGDLQAIIGRSLPEMSQTDLLPNGREPKEDENKLF